MSIMNSLHNNLKSKKLWKVPTLSQSFKIEDCSFISDKKESQVYFFCSCTLDTSALICIKCISTCHKGEGHNSTLFNTSLDIKQECKCGKSLHKIEQKKNFQSLEPKVCMFKDLLKKCIPKFLLKTNERDEGLDNNSGNIEYLTNEYHCMFCEKFNYEKEINIEQYRFMNNKTEEKNIECSYLEKQGRIISVIKFLQQLDRVNYPILSQEEENKNFLKKYLIEVNYNLIHYLEIDLIFEKDIIDNDIKSEFLHNSKNSTYIFSNIFFKYYQRSFFSSRLTENKNFIVTQDFFAKLSEKELIKIMQQSVNYIQLDLDKPELFNSLSENINNGFFIFYNNFYSFIYSFYTKYKIFFKTITILNLTLIQRYYFLLESKSNIEKLGFVDEVDKFNTWLKLIPECLIEFIERIMSFKIHEYDIFQRALNSNIYLFFKVFKFLIKYNLIDRKVTQRFLKLFETILNYNCKNFLNKEKIFIVLPNLESLIKIVLLILLYHNDELCIQSFLNVKGTIEGSFTFTNDDNNAVINMASKIFLHLLTILNFLNTRQESNKRVMIYEQLINKTHRSCLYNSNKANYLIKQIFELLVENERKCKLLL